MREREREKNKSNCNNCCRRAPIVAHNLTLTRARATIKRVYQHSPIVTNRSRLTAPCHPPTPWLKVWQRFTDFHVNNIKARVTPSLAPSLPDSVSACCPAQFDSPLQLQIQLNWMHFHFWISFHFHFDFHVLHFAFRIISYYIFNCNFVGKRVNAPISTFLQQLSRENTFLFKLNVTLFYLN